MTRRPTPSIVANPVLVGAATLLVVVVGVFLAYNANTGLPFVPTYQVHALVPDAAELVPGNDVRIGGKRVGTVAQVEAQKSADGSVHATLDLKLEKAAGPLASDTVVTVRPRSTLGLKYVELKPGTARQTIPDGGTLPLQNAGKIVELDEVLNAFDTQTRRGIQNVTKELSNGLAGRGGDLNEAVSGFAPLVTHLQPVMRALRSHSADLQGFISGIETLSTVVAPVATQLGQLFDGVSTTLYAVDGARKGLAQLLDETPALERSGTEALRVSRPVLADAAAVAKGLRPGTALLETATSRIASALETGTPVLGRATRLGPELEGTLKELGTVAKDPSTSISLSSLTKVVSSLKPTLQTINPFQVNCNYLGLWGRNAASAISEGDANGTWFRFVPVVQLPETFQSATPAPALHDTTYGAVNGECEVGNEGYAPGQVIGGAPGVQPNHTFMTTPPPGTPAGPGGTP